MKNSLQIFTLFLVVTTYRGLAQSKTQIDLQLSTNGTVAFTGTQSLQSAGVLFQKDNKSVLQSAGSEGIIIGSNPDFNGKPHGDLAVSVGVGTQLKFQTQKGDVTINKVKADVTGVVADGDVKINDYAGRLNLFVKKGNIVIDAPQTEGTIATQNGNIILKNPTRKAMANTQNGVISVQFTTDYQLAKPIDYDLEKGDIYLDAVNQAAKLTLGQGTIRAENSIKSIELSITQEGSIWINAARAGVKALTRKGNIELTLAPITLTNEPTWLQTDEGDVIIKMPVQFMGIVEVEILQTRDFNKRYSITSTVELPAHQPKETLSPTGQVISRRTVCRGVFGNLNRLIRVRVCNGNVVITPI